MKPHLHYRVFMIDECGTRHHVGDWLYAGEGLQTNSAFVFDRNAQTAGLPALSPVCDHGEDAVIRITGQKKYRLVVKIHYQRAGEGCN